MPKFSGIVHVCSIPGEKDVLYTFFPGKSRLAEYRRRFRRAFTISSQNSQAMRYFKSHQAIDRERTRHLQSHFYIIHPYSVFKLRWDCLMLFAFLLAFWYFPFYLGFINISPKKHKYAYYTLGDFLLCVLFLIDIIINCFTGYVKSTNSKTNVELIPKKIFLKYLMGFFLDMLTSLPVDHVACYFNVEYFPIYFLPEIRLLKFVRFIKFRKNYFRLTEYYGVKFVPGQVMFWFIFFITFIHLCCCIHNWISLVEFIDKDYPPWIVKARTYTLDMTEQYVINLSMAAYVFLKLDVPFEPPESRIDQVFTEVVGFIGALWFAITIAKCIQWAHIVFAAAKKYEELEVQLSAFMHYRKLPYFLQERIKSYYEFRFQNNYFQEAAILPLLSTSLRENIVMHSCRRMVQNVSFFHGIPTSMLVRVVVCLRPEIFLVNDVIIKAGTHGNCMYFITSGTVAIYSSSGKEICHLEDGAHLGEVALVIEESIRVTSVVAVEVCELQRLDRHDFKREVAPYPDLAMRIERIAEDRLEKSVAFDEFHRRSTRNRSLSTSASASRS